MSFPFAARHSDHLRATRSRAADAALAFAKGASPLHGDRRKYGHYVYRRSNAYFVRATLVPSQPSAVGFSICCLQRSIISVDAASSGLDFEACSK